MTRTRRIAVVVAVVVAVALSAMVPALATADGSDGLELTVDDRGDDGALVTVTANGSAVANATVTVAAVEQSASGSEFANRTYAGTGDYGTDANGTVSLPEPEPETDVTVLVTARTDDASTAERTRLTVDDGDTPLGQLISDFVHENDPSTENGEGGPPAHVGSDDDDGDVERDDDGESGPPEHAGDDESGEDEERTNDDGDDRSEDDAGNGNNGNGNGA